MSYEEGLIEPPDSVWQRLVDTHCHPTDDPSQWSEDVSLLSRKIADARVGKIVAMSTSFRDQSLVAELAELHPDKIVPCFGHHPWFVHTISLSHPAPSKEEHYSQIFGPLTAGSELEEIMPELSEPRSLQDVLGELRSNLDRFSHAMLGEVGIDRAFRIPRKRWSYEPAQEASNGTRNADAKECCVQDGAKEKDVAAPPAADKPKLTKLKTPIEHQLAVVKAQIAIAVELGRNVSFHSVQAAGKTVELMKELCMVHNGGFSLGIRDINISFHSCTMDANVVKTLQKTHANAYIGFSTPINHRHSNHRDILAASDPNRILPESDWHSAEGLASRVWQATRLIGEIHVNPDEDPDAFGTRQLEANWKRFVRNRAVAGDDSDSDG